MSHLSEEEVSRYADGEIGDASSLEQHLQECARCASEVLSVVQMKNAVRDLVRATPVPRRRGSSWGAWALAAAAVIAFVIALAARPHQTELADMHVTMLASASPVDVLSTDRHTVRPWFEGRLPFEVPVPDLAASPFRLIGGRVVYYRGNPAAYLLVAKGAHRISVFVLRGDVDERANGVTTESWSAHGLTFVAIGEVPASDLRVLRQSWERSM